MKKTKYLIIGSKFDVASRNIIMNLMDLGRFNYHLINGDMLKSANLDFLKIKEYDMVIFASKHESKEKHKTLSIHAPGNYREVWGGGKEGRLCPASALFQKHLFNVLNSEAKKAELRYDVTLEATHHGPLIDKPCVFIEIGGSIDEWRDKKASFVVAKTIRRAIETYKENEYYEIIVGIGGGHYCPAFNKLQLKSNTAVAHIIPKYVKPITERMILEAINQTIEEVDFVVLDYKGLGKKEERDEIIKILDRNYISWKKSGEVR